MKIKNQINTLRSSRLSRPAGWALMFFFPLLLVFVTEINQAGDFSFASKLITEIPGVLLFDVLVVSILFYFITLLVKRTAVAAAITGVLFYTLSCVEFYRFRASGAHFTMGDFSLFTNVGDVAKFAKIEIYPLMVILLLVLALYVGAMFITGNRVDWKLKQVLPSCTAVIAGLTAFLMVPTISDPVFSTFGVSYGGSSNNFVLEEKFEDNGMIAFLVDNITDTISTVNIKKPENYSKQSIETFAVQPAEPSSREVQPNVIMIMSESYTDFRVFDKLNLPDGYYDNFDKMASEGFKGTAVVPTFGGYTVKSEFELLFGLPIKALNGTQAPQNLIGDEDQITIAKHYRDEGYATSYIHPYTSDFYNRGDLLPRYGFDSLFFEDQLPLNHYRSYTDDSVAFDQAVKLIKQQDKPSYIHITTMQNHMPYDNDQGQTQLDYYMDGVKNTDKRLGELMEQLKAVEEPTVLLFVGDHFPFFTEQNNVYDLLNINSQNCLELYKQPYVMWANYDADYSAAPTEEVSAFYLPHILETVSGLPENEVDSVVRGQMKVSPVYTMEFQPDEQNEVLNTLTYDLILGDQYTNQVTGR